MSIFTQIESKILTPEQLTFKLHYWRFKDQKIGFTNGCFDLLHLGHIYTLTQAAQHCQVLIVGLNSDESVRRLKGHTRPVQSQQTRALVLASLSYVEAVVIFDDDTPYNLIQQIQPDVLVKGGDYEKASIVGADIVEKNGGTVLVVPYLQGYSTTALLQKMGDNTPG